MEYTPRFIENMTQEEISAEIKQWHDDQYQYGRSIDWNRMHDLEYTLKVMRKEMEDKDMADSKKITFEIDGNRYESNDKGNRFYRFYGTQKVRIGEAEWNEAFDAYTSTIEPPAVDEWEQEANAERKAREDKVAADAKAAEDAVAKKTKKRSKKNAAFTLGDVTLTEKQVDFIKHIPDTDFYENGLESTMWIDVLTDQIGGQFKGKPMTVGAMVSTLREKNLIYVGQDRINGRKCKYFGLTDLGKQVASELGLE